MQRFILCVLALSSLVLAAPGQATECDNVGAVPITGPDDTGDPFATACGGGATASGDSSTAFGVTAVASGHFSTAAGSSTEATGTGSAAVGFAANAAGINSTALGYGAYAIGQQSTAVGYLSQADLANSVAIGSVAGVRGATSYANVGMGTTAPIEAVDVERSAAAARFQLTTFTNTASEAPQFIQRRARGTRLAPTAVQSNDNLGLFSFRGYNGSSMGGSRATITAQAAGPFSASSTPTRLIFATTPVGQTTPQSVLVITPDGKVQVKGVNLNVPDYVFEDDYELMPLDELRTFIDENGHLPGIPSADEVNAEGHDLAGSDMAHLRKIEELTLYALRQEERLVEQDRRLSRQDAEMTAMRTDLEALRAELRQRR